MSNQNQPLVTVGMPVYNEERFVALSIESILAQDHQNFELIIADNDSEDRTGDICRYYAKQDSRINYFRNSKNIGQHSGSKILDASSGFYQMFAAGHDLWHPQFISRLVAEMEKDSKVVLCYPKSYFIDNENNITGIVAADVDTRGLSIMERFRKVIWEIKFGYMMYGLFRADVLKYHIWKERAVIAADHVMVADMSFFGTVAFIADEPLFFMRDNKAGASQETCLKHYHTTLNLNNRYENIIYWTIHAYQHARIVLESNLSPEDKEILLKEVKKCFTNRYSSGVHFGNLIKYEASKLFEEAAKIFDNHELGRCTKLTIAHEFIRLTAICSFFLPEIAEMVTYFVKECEKDSKFLLQQPLEL